MTDFTNPATFVSDQMRGNRITKVVVRKDGSYRYEMDGGVYSFVFTPKKFEELCALCDRLGFKLKFAEGCEPDE